MSRRDQFSLFLEIFSDSRVPKEDLKQCFQDFMVECLENGDFHGASQLWGLCLRWYFQRDFNKYIQDSLKITTLNKGEQMTTSRTNSAFLTTIRRGGGCTCESPCARVQLKNILYERLSIRFVHRYYEKIYQNARK